MTNATLPKLDTEMNNNHQKGIDNKIDITNNEGMRGRNMKENNLNDIYPIINNSSQLNTKL